jgi:Regulator of ribonuclease activity B
VIGPATFPEDENGDVLRRMASHGDNLLAPRNIDFEHIFSSNEAALAFTAQAVNRTDTVSVNWYEGRSSWNVRVTRHMVPTHKNISDLELSLDNTARQFGGKADGWGCMQVDVRDSQQIAGAHA